eukprot:TRINITY_DN90539_c0_g1_i1.p1 TRINITY_DN90539_c0_g1~~TRINITY_DN90539_c0_g1_i1.p1  ORF type:complete len:1456 (-),score=250.84 TRINITY_DN90539_c0_g1_i1:160-4296(-)
MATFGSKVTKCLGASASGDEASASEEDKDGSGSGSALSDEEEEAGRETSALTGRSRASSSQSARARFGGLEATQKREDTSVPQVLRTFPSRVTIVQVTVGGDMLGAHTLAVSRTGRLYAWGYGPACGVGTTSNVATPTLVTKFLGFGAGDPGSGRGDTRPGEMEPLGWGRHSHTRYRGRSSSKHLGLQMLRPRIVKAVCGGGFSAVLSSEGEVFTFGLSAGGRLGFRTKFRAQLRPRRIETLKEGSTDLAAGAGFMLLCTAAGRLISWGDNSKGQLGVGHLQESYEPLHLGRVCPAAFVFQAVAAGDSHSLALDSAGHTYSWGGEGGPMTGQGQPMPGSMQVDAAYQFRLRQLPHWWVRPVLIKALSGMRVVHIAAGCLHSVALTREGVLYAWGSLLQAGVASTVGSRPGFSGPPEVAWIPRLLAPSPKLPLVSVTSASAGGWHSMATVKPSCAIERLSPGDAAAASAEGLTAWECFLDGYLVSRVDSVGLDAEARIHLCCAAVRARLALSDGSDSPIWKAFQQQVVRRRRAPLPPTGASSGHGMQEGATGSSLATIKQEDSDEEEEGESLLDIIAMRRSQQAVPNGAQIRQRRRPPGQTSAGVHAEADEAAGKAVHASSSALMANEIKKTTPVQSRQLGNRQPLMVKKVVHPEFSSDSSGSDRPPPRTNVRAPSSTLAEEPLRPAGLSARGGLVKKKPVNDIFSSDSSGSDKPGQANRQKLSSARRGGSGGSLSGRSAVSSSSLGSARRQVTSLGSARAQVSAAGQPASARGVGGSALGSRSLPNSARSTGSSSASSLRLVDRTPPGKTPFPGPPLPVQLDEFGEVVLTMLVRFLHTDSLGAAEVIDESHSLWVREQQIRMRPPVRGSSAAEVEQQELERPGQQRASKGLLLRREVDDLRRIGKAMRLERLSRLCDQLLLRLDAPGAPALFVPFSTLNKAMYVLLSQALAGPTTQDAPDTRILCGPPGPPRRRWGHRGVPSRGEVWAHAFVLCTTCSGIIRAEDGSSAERGAAGSMSSGGVRTPRTPRSVEQAPGRCELRWRFNRSKPHMELDLKDMPAEVVFAWLRYVYTQEDLTLLWPCCGDSPEEAVAAEVFWTELLRLAQRVGDWRLQLYAQDTLVNALSGENWAQMAAFAEQVQCRILSEAALMTGLRRLLPPTLRSFKVPTGLESPGEGPSGDAGADKTPDASGASGTEFGAATVSSISGPFFSRGASAGQVELEMDRQLLSLRMRDHKPQTLLELKRGSPTQYGELKFRLVQAVKCQQQAADQLQRCVRFYDNASKDARRSDSRAERRTWWLEIFLIIAFFVVALVPPLREGIFHGLGMLLKVVERPLRLLAPSVAEYLSPLGSGVVQAVAINAIAVMLLLLILYQGLKG